MHHVCMRTVWDPDKAKANLEKHGVRFSDAELFLYDPYAVTVKDSAARSADLSSACDATGKAAI